MIQQKLNIIAHSLLLIIITATALPFTENQDYKFTQLKIEDGLSQSTVYSIIQDKRGFMWFGTGNGLNKYDGYKFFVYSNNPSDSTTISDNGIISMFEDREGIIWIGTVAGNINRFDRKQEVFSYKNISELIKKSDLPTDYYFDYPISFARNLSQTITAICEDLNHNLWIGTWGNGVIVIDKKFKLVNHFYNDPIDKNSSLPTNRIMDIQCDSDGQIWIATFGKGLFKAQFSDAQFNSLKLINYLTKSGASDGDDFVLKIFEDKKKNLWIGTYYSGVFFLSSDQKKLKPEAVKFIHYKNSADINSLSDNTVMYFDEDKEGNIWIGTLGGGLDRLNPATNSFINFKSDPSNPNSLADNDILSLYVDNSGIIWAGSHLGKGITKIQLNTTKFSLIGYEPNNPNSLSDGVVWAIHKDKSGLLWIGTYKGGLNCFDPLRKKLLFFKNKSNSKLSSNHIRVITEDDFENLWIGTYDGGLNIYNKRTGEIKIYKHDSSDTNSISGNQIQTILIDGNNYYIGTFGGGINKTVVKGNPFNQKLKFEKFINNPDDEKSISDNRVYKIFKDRENLIWVCTYGGSVELFDPDDKSFRHFQNPFAEKENVTAKNSMTILRDSYNTLWVGTYGGGLYSFEIQSGKFSRYSSREGISSAVVYGILEDKLKNLWISTDNGIFKYDLINKDFTRFDIKDGLQSLEFSGGAYLYSDDGIMYFGGINGINYFKPEEIKTNYFIPPVVITTLKVLDDLVSGEQTELNLEYYQNTIGFEFASLDYSDPRDNLYAYMLEGFDNDWRFTNSSLRIATYTNLSPGEYVFKVRGSNSDGLWNENYSSIIIIISPPIWKTYWFLAIAGLISILILYYVFTVRIKSQLAIEKLKSKLAADLHDNVGAGLTEISILSELAARKNTDTTSNELNKISSLARQLIDNMSDIVWVVNPAKDSLYDLIIRLKNSYYEVLSSMNCELKITGIHKLKGIKIPIDLKQNLYLILKEAFNNAIKHSGAAQIKMNFITTEDTLKITLEDNGIGMNISKINFGNGISNMKKRADEIGWKLSIDSKEGSGTAVIFGGKIKSGRMFGIMK